VVFHEHIVLGQHRVQELVDQDALEVRGVLIVLIEDGWVEGEVETEVPDVGGHGRSGVRVVGFGGGAELYVEFVIPEIEDGLEGGGDLPRVGLEAFRVGATGA
jgi:hypothetical protein